MSTPVRRSISASLSTKDSCSAFARVLPTAVLPEPMGPIRKMLRFSIMQKKRPLMSGRFVDWYSRPRPVSVEVGSLTQDLRRDKDQEFALIVHLAARLEQDIEARNVAEPRYLGLVFALFRLEDATEHYCLPVVHQ